MDGSALQRRLLELRIEQVSNATFPSVDMMNRIEACLQSKDELEAYAEMLLTKIEGTKWPSLAMVNRFEAILERLGVSCPPAERGLTRERRPRDATQAVPTASGKPAG